VLVGRRIVIETRPRPALGRLLLPARLSGVSIHRRLVLGGLGGFGACVRRRGVRRRWLSCGRLDIDHATRPAEIVGPSARRCDSLPRAQPNGRPRTVAGALPQAQDAPEAPASPWGRPEMLSAWEMMRRTQCFEAVWWNSRSRFKHCAVHTAIRS